MDFINWITVENIVIFVLLLLVVLKVRKNLKL